MSPPAPAIPSRLISTALWFGPLLGSLASMALGGALASGGDDVAVVGIAALVLGMLGFLVGVVLMWVWLIRGARSLDRAVHAWHAGALDDAEALCLGALRTVFRGDYRTKALHVLGLCAEARGHFGTGAALFDRAQAAIPVAAAPIRKRHARVLIGAHRGLCLLADGRRGEAGTLLERASEEFTKGDAKGALDLFTDDATWGLGAISINSVLVGLEAGRDPRAPLALAWALLTHVRGSPRETIDLLHREGPILTPALLPREHALARRIELEAQAALGAGAHRTAAVVAPQGPEETWASTVLTGARTSPST